MIRVASRVGSRGMVGIATAGLAFLAGIVPAATPAAADVALGLLGAGALGVAGWGWSVLREVRRLPLQLGARVARSRVDGEDQLRIRARLGRGRAVRNPSATVTWVGDDGVEVLLPALIPANRVVGPFTVVVSDPTGATAEAGTLHVTVRGESGARPWGAVGTYRSEDLQEGSFGGVVPVRRGVALPADDWDTIVHRGVNPEP